MAFPALDCGKAQEHFLQQLLSLEHLMPLDKRNKLSQGLTAKASPCHISLQHKPIDFSKCVKSFLLRQIGTALQENTVKVFLGDPKHGKHSTSCWEMARHCWFMCLFLLEFHLAYAAYCCIAKCLLPRVFTAWNLLFNHLTTAWGQMAAGGQHLENVHLQVFELASNHFSQEGGGNGPSC